MGEVEEEDFAPSPKSGTPMSRPKLAISNSLQEVLSVLWYHSESLVRIAKGNPAMVGEDSIRAQKEVVLG